MNSEGQYLSMCWLALSFLLWHVTGYTLCMSSSVYLWLSALCLMVFILVQFLHYPKTLQMHPLCFCPTPPGKQVCMHQGRYLILSSLGNPLPHNCLFKSLPSEAKMIWLPAVWSWPVRQSRTVSSPRSASLGFACLAYWLPPQLFISGPPSSSYIGSMWELSCISSSFLGEAFFKRFLKDSLEGSLLACQQDQLVDSLAGYRILCWDHFPHPPPQNADSIL